MPGCEPADKQRGVLKYSIVKASLSRDHDLIYPAIQQFWDDAVKGTS